MYAAIYSSERSSGFRKHIGNVTHVKHETIRRTFDFNGATLSGRYDFSIDNPLIYVLCTESGRQIHAGFAKNLKRENDNLLSFNGDDLRRILDTEIILDFTQSTNPSHTMNALMNMVAAAVMSNKDPFISAVSIGFEIPADTTDTKWIANYTGQYITVKAIEFLKPYIAYYGYYIADRYDVVTDTIIFTFKKANTTVTEIRLRDFIHEMTSSDIKVNKVIATIKHKTTNDEPSWVPSDLAYYNSATEKATILGTEPPAPTGYTEGFALRCVTSMTWALASYAEFAAAAIKPTRYYIYYGFSPAGPVSFEQAVVAAGDANQYSIGSVVEVYPKNGDTGEILYEYPQYIKQIPTDETATYYKLEGFTYIARPDMPEKVYTLGKNNQVYEGYAPDNQRIYPIVTRIFEAEYLSEAQINAVYELVNNRYLENILISELNTMTPIRLSELDLYSTVRVYDANGEYKDLPIAEITTRFNEKEDITIVKLGFKKTRLTDIIKNDIAPSSVVKKSGGGITGTHVVKQEYKIWDAETTPDPNEYPTWFRPV